MSDRHWRIHPDKMRKYVLSDTSAKGAATNRFIRSIGFMPERRQSWSNRAWNIRRQRHWGPLKLRLTAKKTSIDAPCHLPQTERPIGFGPSGKTETAHSGF
jgi:hypothetical protein